MTRADFYVLPDASAQGRALLACRLTEKAYARGHSVFLNTESAQQTRQMDELLWTFRQGSFVPHAPVQDTRPPRPPVIIGQECPPQLNADVLVNLAPEIPSFTERFERIVELVDQNEDTLRHARERYSRYRERGYSLESHKVSAQDHG